MGWLFLALIAFLGCLVWFVFRANIGANVVIPKSAMKAAAGNDQEDEPVVLGTQMARAYANEQQRLANGNLGKSLIPQASYDRWRGELSIIAPRPIELDRQMRKVCHTYTALGREERNAAVHATSLDDFYTLLTFAKRAAIFGMRENAGDWIEDGFVAIAMVDVDRVDWRDLIVTLSVLHYAGRKTGMNVDRAIADALALATGQTSRLIAEFSKQPPTSNDLRASCGYEEIETDAGVGFVGWNLNEFHPSYDIARLALRVADVLSNDKYLADDVTLASELPAVWFTTPEQDRLAKILDGMPAVANVSAALRPAEHPQAGSQQLTVFIAETRNADEAEFLASASTGPDSRGTNRLNIVHGRLFLLVVARSFVQGDAPFETQQTIQRFTTQLAVVLENAAQGGPQRR